MERFRKTISYLVEHLNTKNKGFTKKPISTLINPDTTINLNT